MKRNLVIATVAAATLVAGGSATALAVSGDDDTRRSSVRDADDDRNDDARDSEDAAATSAKVSAAEAVDAALARTPGTAVGVDLDDDGGPVAWEVDMLAGSGAWHSVRIDPGTGKVLGSGAEDEDDAAEVRVALKGGSTSAAEAARAAAAKGTVTSVELDEDAGAWEAETRTDGKPQDWQISLTNTQVTPDAS
ncbi:PepSY domain-containing protein [Streptomyces sp. NPDC004082]|uniref:PepSY domain-containing protein n=1 Tax=unclassified Streptomyces TaxID=2593676 RepID=UPI0033B9A884